LACHGGAKRDPCCFGIPDFADHDYVRVLAQNLGKQFGEVKTDPSIDLALMRASEIALHGILDCVNLARSIVQRIEDGVERCGLSAAGWAGYKDESELMVDQ